MFKRVLFVGGLVVGGLVGCSAGSAGGSDVAGQIAEVARTNPDGFVLSQDLSPSGRWTEVNVVCPYGSMADLPDGVAGGSTDELLDEGQQWLVFGDGGSAAGKVALARDVVDFCSGNVSGGAQGADQVWVAVSEDGRWVVSPAG